MKTIVFALAIGLVPVGAIAQDAALEERVMRAVRAAMAPALPFPESDGLGSLPADGTSRAPWMVKPLVAADRMIEVVANPLNEVHQARATRAMAQIEESIQAAQRRADAQFERAMAEAKRTGRSQDVDGVTLNDEGLAGARIDAESHVTIEVLFNQRDYRFEVASAIEPALVPAAVPGAAVIGVPTNVFKAADGDERLCEAESQVYLGRIDAPEVRRGEGGRYEVTASATGADTGIDSIVLRLRGNEALIAELLRKTSWEGLVELLR